VGGHGETSEVRRSRQTEREGRDYRGKAEEIDRLCGVVVRVPGYTTEMYCASCEVRTEFIYVM
jgi:hypothetical protein